LRPLRPLRPLREEMGVNLQWHISHCIKGLFAATLGPQAPASDLEKELNMENKKFQHVIQIVIPAILLVCGLMVIGCSKGSTGGGGGRFNLTDIPSQYNGMYAALAGANLSNTKLAYVGYQSFNGKDKNKLCRISDGRVNIPMWTVDATTEKINKYSGSDKIIATVSIYESEAQAKEDPGKPAAVNIFMSVNFSNGNAAESWKSGMAREAGDSLIDQVLKLTK